MRSLNRVGHESNVKSDKTRKPERNSILLCLKCHLLLLKYLGLLPFYSTLSAYEIGMPTQRSIYINRAILLAKFALNISHINVVLSPIILQLLFTRSNTDGIANFLDVVFCMLSDITITWICARSTTEILLIINSFLRVDKLLRQHPDSPAERSYATNHFNRYLFLVFGYIFLIMIAYVKHTLDYVSIYFCAYITFYQLENAISCGFVVFISALLHLLTERFQYVNRLIEQHTSKNLLQKRYPYMSTTSILTYHRNTNTQDDVNLRMFAQNAAMIYSLHIDLLDIYKMVNKYAGLSLLMFLLYACYGLLSCAYSCFMCEWQTSDDLYYGIWTFSWIPLYAGIIILLATNCAKATNQMRDTSRAPTTNNAAAEDVTTNPRHILVFLRWPLLLLQLVGISPLFTRKSQYEIGLPKRRAIFITRAVLLAKICLNILHIFYLLSPRMLELLFVKSNTDGMTNMLNVALCTLSDVTITWSCAANTDKIINILNGYLTLDKLLKQQFPDHLTERPLATNQFNRYLIWMLSFNCIALFAYAKQTVFQLSFYFFVHTLIYLLQNVISLIFVAFISALLYLLAERLRFVNMLIPQYNRYSAPNRILSRNAFNQDEVYLRRFAKHSTLIYSLHLDLLNLYKMINEYAGLGLLAFVLYACCGLLTCIYISALYIHILAGDLFYMLWTMLWLPYFLAGLILLATNCAKATREANNTSQILARVYGKGKEYQNIIDKFLTKSIRQDVHFTAYGFFVIDNTTLFKISSALVTYLVILIQFKQLEKSKD